MDKFIHKKPKKSLFITKNVFTLTRQEKVFCKKLQRVLLKESTCEYIGDIPSYVSEDGKKRALYISREIVDKIEYDHGNICPENMISNLHRWDYITTKVLGNQDKINIIKQIPNSSNYLLIAAVRINGFYIVTHFETKTSGNTNLKRLLKRGNVLERGHPIGLSTTNQGNKPTRECV